MYNNLDFILIMTIISKKDSIIVRQMLEGQTPATVKDEGAGNCHSSKLYSRIIKVLFRWHNGWIKG